MRTVVRTVADVPVLVVDDAECVLSTETDALDLIGATYGLDVDTVVVPVERLAPEFFDLRSGRAGEFFQKFANYRLRAVVLGDIDEFTSRSEALAAFVRESNRGSQVWFAEDWAGLNSRLSRR